MSDPEVPIASVKRSYTIVEEIRKRDQIGVTELAAVLELPKTTVHNHLQTLTKLGYLVSENGTYRLGTKYIRLSRDCRTSHAVLEHSRAAIENLAKQSNASGQLVVEENGRATVLLATQWDQDGLLQSKQHPHPTYAYLHTNAPGKAILASLPDDQVTRIIEQHGLPERTAWTVTNKSALQKELAAVREQGYATDHSELIEGIVGVSAPIIINEEVYGAVAAYGASSELQPALDENLATLVQESADDIRAEIIFAMPE